MSGGDAKKILERHGFRQVRRESSHMIMQLELEGTTITVPVPDHDELAIGTLSSIIRQSGIARREFEPGKKKKKGGR
jgi:predicted RNA binding protein YcfA (HicA-like mRNA interferase family)